MTVKADMQKTVQAQPATLTVLVGRAEGTVFPLYQKRLTVGRIYTANLVLEDATVSRIHARIDQQDDGHYIEDLGSRWGVEINGQKISSRCKIKELDQIKIGRFILVYHLPKVP